MYQIVVATSQMVAMIETLMMAAGLSWKKAIALKRWIISPRLPARKTLTLA
jgi:hypothetical protein